MKRLLPLIATLFAIACCAAQNLRKVPLADPFILLYDGVYYAYGTGAGSGIEVWTSRDLSTWERAKGNARDGLALHRTDVWGEKWFWAPEVYRLNDKFHMISRPKSTSASPPPTRRWVLSYRRSGNR